MTLPYPNSPDMDENIADSISRIEQNLEYLEGFLTPTIKLLSKYYDMATTNGAVSITGVGFQPSSILVIAHEVTGDSLSWGFSDQTPDSMCTYRDYTGGAGASATKMLYLLQSVGASQEAVLTSYDADGATLTFTRTGVPTGSMVFTLVFIA